MTNHLGTLALHSGGDGARVVGEPLAPAPVLSTTYFTHPDAVGFSASDLQAAAPFSALVGPCRRWSSWKSAWRCSRGGEAALSFRLGHGGNIRVVYRPAQGGRPPGALRRLLCRGRRICPVAPCRGGVEVSFADGSARQRRGSTAAQRPAAAYRDPANPILKLTDIAAVAAIAHAGGAELSVDSTIATPVGTNPLALGADYVCRSLTKYLCGHGDALGGAVIGRADAIAALRRDVLIHHGAVLSPFYCLPDPARDRDAGPRMEKHQAAP